MQEARHMQGEDNICRHRCTDTAKLGSCRAHLGGEVEVGLGPNYHRCSIMGTGSLLLITVPPKLDAAPSGHDSHLPLLLLHVPGHPMILTRRGLHPIPCLHHHMSNIIGCFVGSVHYCCHEHYYCYRHHYDTLYHFHCCYC